MNGAEFPVNFQSNSWSCSMVTALRSSRPDILVLVQERNTLKNSA